MLYTKNSVKTDMATSLISDSQKNTIKAIIDDIHETFARNITVYEEGEKILIAASPEFNGIYGRTSNGQKTTSKVIVSHTLNVRIKYINERARGLRFRNKKPVRRRANRRVSKNHCRFSWI